VITLIDTERAFEKIQHPFRTNDLRAYRFSPTESSDEKPSND
jgi:hypothetical protein